MYLFGCGSFRPWGWRIVFLVCVCYVIPISSDNSPFNIPLVLEELPEIQQDKPGCYMDGTHYGFEDRWNPVFIQHGKMVCIQCQCFTVEKKGVRQFRGRTMCRNIKDLCPVPTCDNPTIKPGKCCKSCDGDEDFEDSVSLQPDGLLNDVYYSQDAAKHPDANDFQALLVGRDVPYGPVSTRATALVRLTIERDKVQFAVRYSHLDRPKYLRILHVNGDMLYQTPIVKDVTGNKKVCGVWSKPLPMYLDYIRKENLMAVITTSRYPDGIIAGKVKVAPDKDKESFSSLLTDTTREGGGGLASISYSSGSMVARYVIITDGKEEKDRQGIFTVSILKGSKSIYKTRGSALDKTTQLSGKWRILKRKHRKQLARGQLRIRIKFANGQVLVGGVQPKLTCKVFQAVLSGSQTQDMTKSPSAGSVVMKIGDGGRIHYSIRLANMVHQVTRIRLEGYRRKRKKKSKMKTIGNLYPTFVRDGADTFNGWSNGTLEKVDADTIHGLLRNKLYVSVTVSHRGTRELRGRVVALNYDHHLSDQTNPATLTAVTHEALGGAAHVWTSIDVKCRLHFQALYVRPRKKVETFQVSIGHHGNFSNKTTIRLPFRTSVGKMFGYLYGSGDVINIPNQAFKDLDNGMTFLQMSTADNSQLIYQANVTIPNTCWLYSNDGDGRLAEDNHLPSQSMESKTCRFEGQVYHEGTAWIPDVDEACTTCSCVKGKIMCQRMTCPKLSCGNPVQIEGRCCPSCPHEDTSQMCQLGKDPRSYPLHSVWHPYLPTEGFSLCAFCTCLPENKVDCYKQPCPKLNCPRSEWTMDDNNTCCYRCKDKTPDLETRDLDIQPQRDVSMTGACIVNGKLHPNGERWNPTLHPFGYMKCFYCVCQNGKYTCAREECPVLKCAKKIRRPNQCCQECDPEESTQPVVEDIDSQPLVEDIDSTPKKSCRFANEWYKEGQRWRPDEYKNSPTNNCVACKCKNGVAHCRQRCPRVCQTDPDKHPCCKNCSKKESKIQRKDENQPKKHRKSPKGSKSNLKRKRRRRKKLQKSNRRKERKRKKSERASGLMSLLQ